MGKRKKHRNRKDKRQSYPAQAVALRQQDTQGSESMWRYFLPILAVGLVARIWFALTSDMPLHPDEILQYLEQAHYLTFGSGILTWEYFIKTRNYLTSGFIAIILYLHELLGLDRVVIYDASIKIIFCLLSMAIPAAMYLAARKHFSEASARCALLFGCFWYELIVFAHKPMTEFIATSFLASAVILYASKHLDALRITLLAVLAVLAVAVRMQFAPTIAVALLVLLYYLPAAQRKYLFVGGFISLVAVGALDYFTLGSWWMSYYRNISANLFGDIAASAFGTAPIYQYLWWLTIASFGMFQLTLIGALAQWRRYWLLLAMLATILLLHSLIGHKEYRFIFLLIPVWLMIAADLSWRLRHPIALSLQTALAGISLAGFSNHLPLQEDVHEVTNGKLYTEFDKERGDIQAMKYLSEQDNVTGVWNTLTNLTSGVGYYYLHKDVPLYITKQPEAGQKYGPPVNVGDYVSHIITDAEASMNFEGFRLKRVFEMQLSDPSKEDKRDFVANLWQKVALWENTRATDPSKAWNHYVLFAARPSGFVFLPDGTIRYSASQGIPGMEDRQGTRP